MPELRIVGDRLWKKVKDRQRGIRKRYGKEYGNRLTAARRQRYLFSGLIKCGECGGGYSVIYRDILGCSTVKNKGTCSNTTRITRHELEARILDTLRGHLMTPDKFELFCKEYTHEINRLRREASAGARRQAGRTQEGGRPDREDDPGDHGRLLFAGDEGKDAGARSAQGRIG